MPKFNIFIDWGYRVGDGGNRDDIAAGEGYDTKVDKFPYTGSRGDVEKEALRLVDAHSPCFGWWIKEDKGDIGPITESVRALKDILSLPEAQSLTSKLDVASTSLTKHFPLYGLHSEEYGTISLTTEGLEEETGKRGTKLERAGKNLPKTPYDESNSRIVPESEFESMVTKYHIQLQELQEVRTKLEKQASTK